MGPTGTGVTLGMLFFPSSPQKPNDFWSRGRLLLQREKGFLCGHTHALTGFLAVDWDDGSGFGGTRAMLCNTHISPVTPLHCSLFKVKNSHGAKVVSPCVCITHPPASSPSPSRKWRGKKSSSRLKGRGGGCWFWVAPSEKPMWISFLGGEEEVVGKQGGKAPGISAGSSEEVGSSSVLVILGYPTATRARVSHGCGAQGTGLGAGAQPPPWGDLKDIPREGKGLVAAPSWDLWGWW